MQTLYINGNIYVERNHFASAMLITDNLVTAVGTRDEVGALAVENAEIVDLQGRTVIPGFNDSHLHIQMLGAALNSVNLNNITSLQGIIDAGKDFIATHNIPKGKVVVGRGWNQDYFTDVSRLPTRHDLDLISTQHPIIYSRACGHMMVCNTMALQVAGVDENTAQVEGAQFDLEENGYPNGIFRELAANLIMGIIPVATVEELKQNFQSGIAYAVSQGITSLQSTDAHGEDYHEVFAAAKQLDDENNLNIRLYEQCCFYEPTLLNQYIAEGYQTGQQNKLFTVGPLKLFVDGSLGARTALMRNDYHDEAGTKGIQCMSQEQLNEMVNAAHQNNIQVAVHCIGDGAIEMVLDSYENVIQNRQNPLRHGIIHCQITDMPLLNRFAENDILALVQPIFIHYDMHVVAQRVGAELAETSYAFGTMGKMGIHVGYGTDCPVEDLNPFHNLYCAVTRQDLNENSDKVYNPQECVDIYTAIDNYTLGSAYCSFEENTKGRLQEGFLADFAVLDRDIFSVTPEEIKTAQAVMTVVDGKVVYNAL